MIGPDGFNPHDNTIAFYVSDYNIDLIGFL
jgi:hypothetical protein